MCTHDSGSPVCFAPTSPVDVPPGGLVFYDVVEPDVVSRSSVLACIAEADGEARLPEAVTVSDLRTWLTAIAWPVHGEQRKSMSLSSICTVVKVADALDDKDLVEWVQLAADHFISLLPETEKWRHRDQDYHARALSYEFAYRNIEADMGILSALPGHLQDQVFAAVAASQRHSPRSPPFLHMLLAELEHNHALCTRILAGALNPNKELHLQSEHASKVFINTLTSLPTSPPQLLSLTVSGADESSSSALLTAEHAARVLRHHSGLSTLSLNAPCHRTDAFKLLAPALSALPAMRSLHLGTSTARIAKDSLPILQTALQCMPLLEELRLCLRLGDHSTKRQRDADAPPPQQHCLATTLSPATALTSLYINAYPASQAEAFRGTDALKLPHLSNLSLCVNSCTNATDVFSRLVAPLTSLMLGRATTNNTPAEDAADTERCVGTLSNFPLLRQLSVCNAFQHEWLGRMLATMLTTKAPELMVLQQLHTLALDANSMSPSALNVAAPRLPFTLPGLRCLSMSVDSTCTDAGTQERWADTCEHLSLLQLQKLDLSLVGGGLRVHAVNGLTFLSALRVVCDFEKFASDVRRELPDLVKMTQLQRLHLEVMELQAETLAALMPGLAALPSLTALVIDNQAPKSLADAFSACKPGAWPLLQHLGVDVGCWHRNESNRALVRAACRLPALKQLALQETDFGCDGSESDLSEIMRADLEGYDLMQELNQIAKQAGVAVSFVNDWSAVWSGHIGGA